MNDNITGYLRRDFLLLFLLIGCFFIIGLGARPYITPSEARYIEIPRQMLATGDFLTPHINGVQYFEKPPLFYWMQAVFMSIGEVFNSGEFWGRIATVLVVTITCLVTYATGRLLYGRAAGFLAAGALATSVLGYGLAHVAVLDAPVTLFLTCAISSFIFAQKTGQKKFYYFMYAAAALAVMIKGLIGIVIPALVIGGWILLTNNDYCHLRVGGDPKQKIPTFVGMTKKKLQILKEARLFTGTLLFLAIAAPWHILMARIHPEFLDFYFIHEHFTRFISNEHKRTAPWWFFIAVTAAGVMPWLGAMSLSSSTRIERDSRLRGNDKLFLCLWILLPLIFFSASHSKLVPYIFPIFPPIFILIGKQLADWWELPVAPKLLRVNALFMVLLLVGGLVFLLTAPSLSGGGQGWGIMPLVLVGTVLFIAAIIKKTPAKTLIAWHLLFGAALGLTANYIAADFDKRTIKPLTEILKPQLKDDDLIVAYNSYWQDLPVYLNRNITVAGWTGELSFGVKHMPNAKNWMISLDEFWVKCAQEKTNVYVFINEKDFLGLPEHENCPLHEMNRYGKTVLLKKEKP